MWPFEWPAWRPRAMSTKERGPSSAARRRSTSDSPARETVFPLTGLCAQRSAGANHARRLRGLRGTRRACADRRHRLGVCGDAGVCGHRVTQGPFRVRANRHQRFLIIQRNEIESQRLDEGGG